MRRPARTTSRPSGAAATCCASRTTTRRRSPPELKLLSADFPQLCTPPQAGSEDWGQNPRRWRGLLIRRQRSSAAAVPRQAGAFHKKERPDKQTPAEETGFFDVWARLNARQGT